MEISFLFQQIQDLIAKMPHRKTLKFCDIAILIFETGSKSIIRSRLSEAFM